VWNAITELVVTAKLKKIKMSSASIVSHLGLRRTNRHRGEDQFIIKMDAGSGLVRISDELLSHLIAEIRSLKHHTWGTANRPVCSQTVFQGRHHHPGLRALGHISSHKLSTGIYPSYLPPDPTL
jgi:hypothetical protein